MVNDFSMDNSEARDDNQASDHDELDNGDLEGRREIVQVGVNSALGIGELDETNVVLQNPIDIANKVVEADSVRLRMDETVAEFSINNEIEGGSDSLVAVEDIGESGVTKECAGMDFIMTEHDEHDNVSSFSHRVSHLAFSLTRCCRKIFRDHKNKSNAPRFRILLQSQQQSLLLTQVELTWQHQTPVCKLLGAPRENGPQHV